MKKLFIGILILILGIAVGYTVGYDRGWKSAVHDIFKFDEQNHQTNPNLKDISIQFNQLVTSPLTVTGEAKGTWFFEATFPIKLTDWDGRVLAESFATAKSDWMTEDFVPFEATFDFEVPEYVENGSLVLQKSNPSGLPENYDAVEIPVKFK